jgi:hypothetical protein
MPAMPDRATPSRTYVESLSMSTPVNLHSQPFSVYILRDVTTGAQIATGRAYQWNPEATNIKEANSYTFIPPITIKPGLMILFKGDRQ